MRMAVSMLVFGETTSWFDIFADGECFNKD